MILFDFTRPEVTADWSAIDDVVMGGMSHSRLRTEGGTGVFTGELSLRDNDGFASITSPSVSFDLGPLDGIALRVRGDGKTYGLILRCRGESRLRYQAPFFTEPELWETVYVPFEKFQPRRLGAYVWGAPPLDTREISGVGLLLTGDQAGEFRLEIDWIAAYPVGE